MAEFPKKRKPAAKKNQKNPRTNLKTDPLNLTNSIVHSEGKSSRKNGKD